MRSSSVHDILTLSRVIQLLSLKTNELNSFAEIHAEKLRLVAAQADDHQRNAIAQNNAHTIERNVHTQEIKSTFLNNSCEQLFLQTLTSDQNLLVGLHPGHGFLDGSMARTDGSIFDPLIPDRVRGQFFLSLHREEWGCNIEPSPCLLVFMFVLGNHRDTTLAELHLEVTLAPKS